MKLLQWYYMLLVLRVMLRLLMWVVAEQRLLVVTYLDGRLLLLVLLLLLLLLVELMLGNGVRILFPATGHTVLRTLARTLTHTLTRTCARTVALRGRWRFCLGHRIHRRHRCTSVIRVVIPTRRPTPVYGGRTPISPGHGEHYFTILGRTHYRIIIVRHTDLGPLYSSALSSLCWWLLPNKTIIPAVFFLIVSQRAGKN